MNDENQQDQKYQASLDQLLREMKIGARTEHDFPIKLTSEELADRGVALSKACNDVTALELELKRLADRLKSQIKIAATARETIALEMQDKTAMRPVVLECVADHVGLPVRLVRTDTNDTIRTRPMTETERQITLDNILRTETQLARAVEAGVRHGLVTLDAHHGRKIVWTKDLWPTDEAKQLLIIELGHPLAPAEIDELARGYRETACILAEMVPAYEFGRGLGITDCKDYGREPWSDEIRDNVLSCEVPETLDKDAGEVSSLKDEVQWAILDGYRVEACFHLDRALRDGRAAGEAFRKSAGRRDAWRADFPMDADLREKLKANWSRDLADDEWDSVVVGFRAEACVEEPEPTIEIAGDVTADMLANATELGIEEGERLLQELGGKPLFLGEGHLRSILATYPALEKEWEYGLSRAERDAYLAAIRSVVEKGAKTQEEQDIELCREKGTQQGRQRLHFMEGRREVMSREVLDAEVARLADFARTVGHDLGETARAAYFEAMKAECEPVDEKPAEKVHVRTKAARSESVKVMFTRGEEYARTIRANDERRGLTGDEMHAAYAHLASMATDLEKTFEQDERDAFIEGLRSIAEEAEPAQSGEAKKTRRKPKNEKQREA